MSRSAHAAPPAAPSPGPAGAQGAAGATDPRGEAAEAPRIDAPSAAQATGPGEGADARRSAALTLPRIAMPSLPALPRPHPPRLFTTVALAAALLLLLKSADLFFGAPLVNDASAQSMLGPEPPTLRKDRDIPPGETEIYVESAGRETPEQTPTNPLDARPTEAVLTERISERRRLLEEREREMEMRESLLKAAEARIEERIGSLRAMELRAENGTADEAGVKPDADMDRIVTMYEAMKAKEAARILSELDIDVLEDVARRMNPRKLADIMGEMDAKPATRLTVRLAGGSGSAAPAVMPNIPANLPRIQGEAPTN